MNMKKRLCVFAHYDKNQKIDDYVIYYLNELKKVTDKLIFVSDCELPDSELSKLQAPLYACSERHGEYDFGSFKRGFLYAKEHNLLSDVDELIFANDSCFGPIYQFNEIFNNMENSKSDFWGLTLGFCRPLAENKKCEKIKHVQSYFIVFKRAVFLSEAFEEFIKSITKVNNKFSVVNKYEIGMTLALKKAGFNFDTYMKELPDKNYYAGFNKKILQNRFPLIKKGIFRGLPQSIIEKFTNDMKKSLESSYPFELINKYYCKDNVVKFKSILKLIKRYYFRYNNKNLFFVNKWYKF